MSSLIPTPSSPSSNGADNIAENKQMSPSSQTPVVLQPNDVISGRGNEAKAYNHPGNMYFRHLVKERRLEYVASQKRDKPAFAKEIVRCVSHQKPPGRFMKVDKESGLWFDIGYKQALMKTRQALREGAPMIGKKIQCAKHMINRQNEAAAQQQEAFTQASMIQQHAMQQVLAARNGAMLPNFVSNSVDLSAGFLSAPSEQHIDPTSMQNILNNNMFASSQFSAEKQPQLPNVAQPFLLPVVDDILPTPGQGIPRVQGNEISGPYFAHPRFPQRGENTINSSLYSPPSQGLNLRANVNANTPHVSRLPPPSLSEIRIQNNYAAANLSSVRNATPQFLQQRDYYAREAMNKMQESNSQIGYPRVYREGQQPDLERDVTHFQHHRR